MQDDEFELKVIVDADNKILNAIGGQILLPEEFLEIKEIILSGSKINFWVQPPAQTGSGQVTFSGMVPGGFSGKLAIFSIILKAKKSGTAEVIFAKPEAYLHDGLGSSDATNVSEIKIVIEPRAPESEMLTVKMEDDEPPENFQPEIIDAEKTLGIKYALIFFASDKKSGINFFEVMEQRVYRLFGFEFKSGKYVQADSPYRLKDQKLKSEIFVKAVDNRGNYRIARLPPSSPIRWYENPLIWGIIVLALILFAFFAFYANKFKNKRLHA